tara:strand:- start:126 stop:1013 length:888 start_codon:yes stop_codon:yes gene_type:complete
MFFELIVTFFIDNPYSFSPYNKSFVSIFVQDYQTVSILTNLAFATALAKILILKKNIYFHYFILIISCIVCYYTYNRTALLLNFTLIGLLYFSIKGFGRAFFAVLLVVILLLVANSIQPLTETSNSQKTDLSDLHSIFIRFLLLYVGIKVFISNFLIGVGPFLVQENMWKYVQNIGNDNYFDSLLFITKNTTLIDGIWISKPHVAFLVLILNFGFIAILFYLSIFKNLLKSFKNRFKDMRIIIPLTCLFVILVHNAMYPQLRLEYLIFFVLVLKYQQKVIRHKKKISNVINSKLI